MTTSPRSPQPASSASPSAFSTRRRASSGARLARAASTANAASKRDDHDSDDPFLVTCLHNFRPTDPDQLPFRKRDVLQIIRVDQQTGWWAARRLSGSNKIGWIPRDFVKRIPPDVDRRDVVSLRTAGIDVSDVVDAPVSALTSSIGSVDPSAYPYARQGEIVFKSTLSPTSVSTATEPTPVHPFRSAARVPPPRMVDDDLQRALALISAPESSPVPIPSSAGAAGKNPKGKSPLKLNTNLVVDGAPRSPQQLSPLSFADALQFSPTYGDYSAVKLSSSEGSSRGGPRTPPLAHPFSSSEWAARIDAPARSSPSPSSDSTPPPSPPRVHIQPSTISTNRPPVHRARSSTVADPSQFDAPGFVRPYTRGIAASTFARSRSKSALGANPLAGQSMTPTTARSSRPILNIMSSVPGADMSRRVTVRQLAPQTSTPDLRTASRRASDKIIQLTGEPLAAAALTAGPGRSMDVLDEEEGIPGPSRVVRGGGSKIMQLTGDPKARAIIDARERMRSLPWFLRPALLEGRDIQTETDGTVKAGTVPALLEWLVCDPLIPGQEKLYSDVFIKTLTSFTTSDVVFSSLKQQFMATPPAELDDQQLHLWHEKHARVQMRVLDVLRSWLEDHHMLQEDDEIASRTQAFLAQIRSPPQAALTARQILLSLDRLQSSPGDSAIVVPTYPSISRRRARQQPADNVLSLDPTLLAQQLTILDALMYSRLRPQELVRYMKDQKCPGTKHVREFCGMSDRVAKLVKWTILELDQLDRRADALEFWIKVAHKCLGINNVSSMSAIVAALTSVDISRLERTWSEVQGSSHKLLQQMSKYNDPNGNHSACRQLLQNVDGPCVPFIAMYLRDLIHVQEAMPDKSSIGRASSPVVTSPPSSDEPIINFAKRHTAVQRIDTILRHQQHPYALTEDAPTIALLQERMAFASATDHELFWKRSQAIRREELAFIDIKRQMEWAGF